MTRKVFKYLFLFPLLLYFSIPSAIAGDEWGSLAPQTAGDTIKIPDLPKRGLCIAIMPFMDPRTRFTNKQEHVDAHLRNYLGQMKDIDKIYVAKTVDEWYEILAKIAHSGQSIERLIILGHGLENDPGITLDTQTRLEISDLDLEVLQYDLLALIKKYKESREAYCLAIGEGKTPLNHIRFNVRNLPKQISDMGEKVRRRQKQIESVAEVMSNYGRIMLLNCYGARTEKHEEFLRQLGRVLMWNRTGGYITASKRRIDANLVAGGQTGYRLVDHLIGSCRMIQAFVKTARIVQPGDYYVSGEWADYFNWKDFPIQSGGQPPYEEGLIHPNLLSQAAKYRTMSMPDCKANPEKGQAKNATKSNGGFWQLISVNGGPKPVYESQCYKETFSGGKGGMVYNCLNKCAKKGSHFIGKASWENPPDVLHPRKRYVQKCSVQRLAFDSGLFQSVYLTVNLEPAHMKCGSTAGDKRFYIHIEVGSKSSVAEQTRDFAFTAPDPGSAKRASAPEIALLFCSSGGGYNYLYRWVP